MFDLSSFVKDLTGKVFNKITVIKVAGRGRAGNALWECLCHCGKVFTASSDHLTRKKNPIKSCSCTAWRTGKGHRQWGGYEDISGNWWYNHVERERKQTKRPQIPVTITKDFAWGLFIRQGKKCALSGVDLVISNVPRINTASIDRIDSGRGYEEDNIQWVHKHINFMKRTYSQNYFIDMCRKVSENASYVD